MAQAMRPPASPVGSVLSDTHSMNPWNGASSSILPGPEESIGERHGFPGTLAGADVHNEWIETRLTSMLDDTGLRLAVEQAMPRRPCPGQFAINHAGLRRHAGVVRHQSDRCGFPASRWAGPCHRHVVVRGGARQAHGRRRRGQGDPARLGAREAQQSHHGPPKRGSKARCWQPAAWRARCLP
jgi:hypothetical protein